MEAEQIVSLLRRIRHEYGNDLQVIGGYIDLNRLEQAREYIHAVVEQHNQERMLFDSLPAEAALYFYQQALSCRDLGVILRYKDCRVDSHAIFEKRQEPYQSLKRLAEKNAFRLDREPYIYASITAQSGRGQMVSSGEPLGREVLVPVEE